MKKALLLAYQWYRIVKIQNEVRVITMGIRGGGSKGRGR